MEKSFEDYCTGLVVDNMDDIMYRFKRITNKLNEIYWESTSEEDHSLVVGSLGRGTAIKGVSDLDMLFILPDEILRQYNNRQGNKQSALLQDVKRAIRTSYPKSIVRGDGQVVVVKFSDDMEIEVCPVFKKTDGSFLYPDSNDGGKWRTTNPSPEITTANEANENSSGHFVRLCNMTRAWKNNQGFKFGGLLVDTLCYNFLEEKEEYKSEGYENYLPMLKDFFLYLKDQNEEQTFWYALGSRQKVYNKKCKFVKKAKNAYEKLDGVEEGSDACYEALSDLLGKDFPLPEIIEKTFSKRLLAEAKATNTEQFIEDLFPVDIRYNLRIDCKVTQDGYQPFLLRDCLRVGQTLKLRKSLEFRIVENEIDDLKHDPDEDTSYKVYWKVRNVGEEAIARNMIRGQIVLDEGKQKRKESTTFRGSHYVECYVVQNGVCVARDRIRVPISNA